MVPFYLRLALVYSQSCSGHEMRELAGNAQDISATSSKRAAPRGFLLPVWMCMPPLRPDLHHSTSAHECTVLPFMREAMEFNGAKYTKCTPCFHPHTSWKYSESHFITCVFPEPGKPWPNKRTGSSADLFMRRFCSSFASKTQRPCTISMSRHCSA